MKERLEQLSLYCRYEELHTLHEVIGRVLQREDYGKLAPETEAQLKDKSLVNCLSCRSTYVVGEQALNKRRMKYAGFFDSTDGCIEEIGG